MRTLTVVADSDDKTVDLRTVVDGIPSANVESVMNAVDSLVELDLMAMRGLTVSLTVPRLADFVRRNVRAV